MMPPTTGLVLQLLPIILLSGNGAVTFAADDFVFDDLPPWGDSRFGEYFEGGSGYHLTGVHDIRHVGWSWNPIRTTAPFCSTSYLQPTEEDSRPYDISGCVYPEDQCAQVGGHLFDTICMQDPSKPFTVLGPDCWNKKCSSSDESLEASRQICENILGGAFANTGRFSSPNSPVAVDGTFIGASWCLVPGRHTVLGPACYGEDCFTEELGSVCQDLGGTIFADMYCLLDQKYTVIGPTCRPGVTNANASDACFPQETVEKCTSMGGKTVGDIFCVVPEVYSALGPFCTSDSFLATNFTGDTNFTGCWGERGLEICNAFGGTSFGDGIYCAIKGSDYHYFSTDTGRGCILIGGEYGGEESSCEKDYGGMNLGFCACVFKGDYTVGGPLFWDNTVMNPTFQDRIKEFSWPSAGFVLGGSYTVYGPNCYGNQCTMAASECEKAGGRSISGIFCAMPTRVPSKTFSFSIDDGLPGGIVLVLSLLSVATVLEGIVLYLWWRKRNISPEKERAE